MDNYQVGQAPFYTSPNSSVAVFKYSSRDRPNSPVTVIRCQLLRTAYQAHFPETIDAVLNAALDKARTEDKSTCKIVEVQVDLTEAPEQYTVVETLDAEPDGETELREYLEEASRVLLAARNPSSSPQRQGITERYQVEPDPFYISDTGSVSLFKGSSRARSGHSIIVKRHEFSAFQGKEKLHNELAKAINTAIAQARVEHPNICRVLEIHLDTSYAPKRYYLSHILEALDRDVDMEIDKRRRQQRPMSDWELWGFLEQTASALAYAHSKVRYS